MQNEANSVTGGKAIRLIRVWKQGNSWVAHMTADGLGTFTAPTPWTALATFEQVKAGLEARNPGYTVVNQEVHWQNQGRRV